MNLDEYKVGDEVEVLYQIPQTNYKETEWRPGKVTRLTTIYPEGAERFKPYTAVFVDFIRTYYLEGEFVDKPSQDMIVYPEGLKPKEK